MLVEQFVTNKANLDALRNALSTLSRLNFFAVLLDVAARRNIALPSDKPIENAALRAAWHNGYVDAVNDLFYFIDRYVITPKEQTRSDFGALDKLLKNNEITQEEYDRLTNITRD